ncbi:MAG: tRNA-dihydrouridine synthase family protein [Gammaproteobacteria bacterium]|nr:tRNA-dihydrouridine synthase family protein [Gammaproteobacteria bacterium]
MSFSADTKICLAPMEGVIDAEMREVFTSLGGLDRCVTEFVRVTEQRIPERVFFRYSPELLSGGHTSSGVPVYTQLLGGSSKWMGVNAMRLGRLKPPGIDINFGCPSKTVNKREGGSVLLKEPQRVREIVEAVRDAVDPATPVTAKIRLGFSHMDDLEEIVEGVVEAGASELCIHARTKDMAYKPPAHWHEIKRVLNFTDKAKVPIIVNGDIWNADAANNALLESGAQSLMLGRGVLRTPDLAMQIKSAALSDKYTPLTWAQVLDVFITYLSRSTNQHPNFVGNRAKQWLGFLKVTFPQAESAFQRIKKLKEADEVIRTLDALRP